MKCSNSTEKIKITFKLHPSGEKVNSSWRNMEVIPSKHCKTALAMNIYKDIEVMHKSVFAALGRENSNSHYSDRLCRVAPWIGRYEAQRAVLDVVTRRNFSVPIRNQILAV